MYHPPLVITLSLPKVGILTGVAGFAPEGVWVPGGGIEFPCEYVLYGGKKYREIVRQTLRKVQKSRKRKRED